VQPAGVRRLNHIPLFIIGAVAAVVAVLLAFVAFDKSKPPAPAQGLFRSSLREKRD